MSITLTLSGNNSYLTVDFLPPLELDQNYVAGLIDLQTYNSIPNIDIQIQQADALVLPHESYIYIEGAITKADGQTIVKTAKFVNNAMAYPFSEIQYLINGVVVDQNTNVGITSTLKNYISLNQNEVVMLDNASWS